MLQLQDFPIARRRSATPPDNGADRGEPEITVQTPTTRGQCPGRSTARLAGELLAGSDARAA